MTIKALKAKLELQGSHLVGRHFKEEERMCGVDVLGSHFTYYIGEALQGSKTVHAALTLTLSTAALQLQELSGTIYPLSPPSTHCIQHQHQRSTLSSQHSLNLISLAVISIECAKALLNITLPAWFDEIDIKGCIWTLT